MSKQTTRKVKKKNINGFSREQMDEFKEVFELFGETEEGLIRPNDILYTMRETGLENKHPAIYNFIKDLVDKIGDDEIDFDTFVNSIKERFSDNSKEDTIKNNFELFAEPGEKYIDVYSIKKLAQEMGEEDEEILELLKEVENSGEKITYEEFNQILSEYKKSSDK
ncbi:MAG: hypothetical protein MJ252_28650 [archaeon]|nr:hypothetical protein [archaeon]